MEGYAGVGSAEVIGVGDSRADAIWLCNFSPVLGGYFRLWIYPCFHSHRHNYRHVLLL